jgi:serine/threonine protein kinase
VSDERLYREVQALEYMDGNGTPRLYESNAGSYGDLQQVLYAITEFIDGPMLSAAVNKKRLDMASARKACEQLSETLERLHRVGHKHRDLKPDNVILRNGSIEDPVLVDFGMASAADEESESFQTEGNQEIGNRFLRLPEYSAGAHRDDARSDITQLVALFFYMITALAPRQLVDSDGRRPHEREHPRLAPLRHEANWPRLRALFGAGFNVELDKRIADLTLLRARLRALGEPLADAETLQEIDRLTRTAAHPDLRSHAERHSTLVSFSERFVVRVRDILHNANVEIETDDHLSPAGRHAEVSIAVRLREHTWPIVHVRHTVHFDNDGWHAEFHTDGGQPVKYLTMPGTASLTEIQDVIDLGAARVVKNLVRQLNYQMERVPELRRARPGARTRLTDLREEYPIGIDVTVEQRESHKALVLSFQNNSGATQPASFSVLLLFPLALGAVIEGTPSVEQEEKYDRFTFDISLPLADRATMSGPIVHLSGDASAAPPESHIFSCVKAGDSQFTTSIKIEDVLGIARTTRPTLQRAPANNLSRPCAFGPNPDPVTLA